MGRLAMLAAAGFLLLALCLGGLTAVIAGTLDGSSAGATAAGQGGQGGSSGGGGGGGGGPAVPASWELLDREAAATCPGLPWAVLAAIGRVESDSGQSTAPGVHSGANAAGAEGPMQFEPATFAAYATTGPGGAVPPSPYDPVDAVYTAAALLCADGGGTGGGGTGGGLAAAVGDYDHSTVYVETVLVLAQAVEDDPTVPSVPATALAFAAGEMGTPYLYGGTGTGGYDCSGLVQAAYRAAGVTLPRVAQTQYDAGPAVGGGTPLLPGDLVFFGTSSTSVEHVGIYVGAGQMIDAPYTGTVVRIDPASTPRYVGATRPA